MVPKIRAKLRRILIKLLTRDFANCILYKLLKTVTVFKHSNTRESKKKKKSRI